MAKCPVIKSMRALPELSRPAVAGDIRSGYQALDREGEIITGTADIREYATVTMTNHHPSYLMYYAHADAVGVTRLDYGKTASIRVDKGQIMVVGHHDNAWPEPEITPYNNVVRIMGWIDSMVNYSAYRIVGSVSFTLSK